MWLQTRVGFFSIVSKPEDAQLGRLTVRARVETDLTGLRQKYLPELGPVQHSSQTDYRFRAHAAREAVARALSVIAFDIDYDNFKHVVAQEQGRDRAHLYGRVWGELYRLQDGSTLQHQADTR